MSPGSFPSHGILSIKIRMIPIAIIIAPNKIISLPIPLKPGIFYLSFSLNVQPQYFCL